MLSAIPDLSAQEKTNSSALCKRDRNNNKTTVVVVVAISHYSIYIPLLFSFEISLVWDDYMALPNKWVPITINEKFVLWKLESMINSEPIIVKIEFSRNENMSNIMCS